jgi:hypothetical protein
MRIFFSFDLLGRFILHRPAASHPGRWRSPGAQASRRFAIAAPLASIAPPVEL